MRGQARSGEMPPPGSMAPTVKKKYDEICIFDQLFKGIDCPFQLPPLSGIKVDKEKNSLHSL